MKRVDFGGNLVIVGFGSIGQGVLPLILRHFGLDGSRITILSASAGGREEALRFGASFRQETLDRGNYRAILEPLLKAGDFLLNLSVTVASRALVALCREKGVLYLDTCIEPWAEGYTDPDLPPALRSNYALREDILTLRDGRDAPTALVAHGANPGLVSHFIKQALLDIARDVGHPTSPPVNREGWAGLMQSLGVRVVHVAERDTQFSASRVKAADEFVNTWSIEGFVGEGCQPAELGWGSHEKTLPPEGRRHDEGNNAAIYLMRPGAGTRVRSWTPLEGSFHGFLITHNESISTADYYTVRDEGQVLFRPTVHYAYHPCDDAILSLHELAGKNWAIQSSQRLMMNEIEGGIDELGVLLMGHAKGVYWYGSRLSVGEARSLCPCNNATSLQVAISVLAGMMWVAEHPRAGLVEPEDVDFAYILDIARPYLGPVVGVYADWTPLQGRAQLFPEDLDETDPWQFRNFRVV
ncbi:MAG: saccharopine dehydrogenase C-terminal domain-containing protein [Rhodospirillaceae bacterium]|nr:saccharopine dehydrogenase C-terminal domain-containing protein [Rhodospirillaceae bacterium]